VTKDDSLQHSTQPGLAPLDTPFSSACRRCSRLAQFLDAVGARFPAYHAKPVPPFGSLRPRLLVVGLAPGMHGANRTGRPFTGDHAGILLYETLHRFGFASAPVSQSFDDTLSLLDCRITNAVKCLPPGNRPAPEEIRSCNTYLAGEIRELAPGAAILSLGAIAHSAVLLTRKLRPRHFPFVHGAQYELPGGNTLFSSYHCSRYNTQTKRLNREMFDAVFARIRTYLQ
jgi:uracil-DNA glycosylase